MDNDLADLLEQILDLSHPVLDFGYSITGYRSSGAKLDIIHNLASEALSLTSNHLVKERL